MSATLVLKIAAPIFAFAVSGLIWAVAGPLPAGLSLVTFLLGVVTSELDHMRWKTLEEPVGASESDSALLALLDAGKQAAPAASSATPPPRHYYRCTRDGLAIGSGRRRATVVERSRRRPVEAQVPEPLSEAESRALEAEFFDPPLDSPPPPAEAAAPEPTEFGVAPPSKTVSLSDVRSVRAEPPPPKVTILRASYAERTARR